MEQCNMSVKNLGCAGATIFTSTETQNAEDGSTSLVKLKQGAR